MHVERDEHMRRVLFQKLDQLGEKALQRAGRKAVARGEIRLEECVICLIQKTVAVYGK